MADDLFAHIAALWTKEKLEGTPPVYMMHRFLASDRDYAEAAKCLQIDLRREPHLVVGVWQALLPKATRAPRLAYAAPKRGPAAEQVTLRMMTVLGERRRVVEEMQAIVQASGRWEELCVYFGIGPDEKKPGKRKKATRKVTTVGPAVKKKPPKRKATGLLA